MFQNYLRARGEYLPLWWWPWGSRELPPRARRIPAQATGLTPVTELPPRARRIRLSPLPPDPRVGTTSACAENTWIGRMRSPPPWNYLRVRGEYYAAPELVTEPPELPPRARRILCGTGPWTHSSGTTSACAENTPTATGRLSLAWNYLRVRGEYIALAILGLIKSELPPRARRIPSDAFSLSRVVGTTSACAENTLITWREDLTAGNYLRVRGEYSGSAGVGGNMEELPPRARRIQVAAGGPSTLLGTTSACAENTLYPRSSNHPGWNYLRVRGEYSSDKSAGLSGLELPPRARRIPPKMPRKKLRIGTTSACAENTQKPGGKKFLDRNYLRVRGEYPEAGW